MGAPVDAADPAIAHDAARTAPMRAVGWAFYLGCMVATLGALCSAAFAADTTAVILVAVGAMLPVAWAIRPESRRISLPEETKSDLISARN